MQKSLGGMVVALCLLSAAVARADEVDNCIPARTSDCVQQCEIDVTTGSLSKGCVAACASGAQKECRSSNLAASMHPFRGNVTSFPIPGSTPQDCPLPATPQSEGPTPAPGGSCNQVGGDVSDSKFCGVRNSDGTLVPGWVAIILVGRTLGTAGALEIAKLPVDDKCHFTGAVTNFFANLNAPKTNSVTADSFVAGPSFVNFQYFGGLFLVSGPDGSMDPVWGGCSSSPCVSP